MTTQVITIGNMYEMMHPSYYNDSELAKIDAQHLSQKALYWLTEQGPPTITIVGKTLKPTTIESLPSQIRDILPGETIIATDCFKPTKSLIENEADWNELIKALEDGTNTIHIAAYWFSEYIPILAEKLRMLGFKVTTEYSQDMEAKAPKLIHFLNNKVSFHEWLVEQGLGVICPYTFIAEDLDEVATFLQSMGPDSRWMLKSAYSVGGAGVFRLLSEEKMNVEWLQERMTSLPGYSAFPTPPFLVEQDVSLGKDICFPTADFFIHLDGTIGDEISISIQRIADGRYYMGFETNGGRIPADTITEIRNQVTNIASKLSAEGYRGWGNFDFAIRDQSIFFLEFNPRRSALLDGLNLKNRLLGRHNHICFMEDYMEGENITSESFGDYITILDAFSDSTWDWSGIISMAPSNNDFETTLQSFNLPMMCDDITTNSTFPKNPSHTHTIEHGGVTIRCMRFSDIEDVYHLCMNSRKSLESLDIQSGYLAGAWSREQYRFALHNAEDVKISVAESDEGSIVGVFSALRFDSIERLYPLWTYGDEMLTVIQSMQIDNPRSLWGDHMAVSPNYRRRGIATQLRLYCLSTNSEEDSKSEMGVVLRSPDSNTASEELLLRNGLEYLGFVNGVGKHWMIIGTKSVG